jgi:hypothetical protein
LELAEVVSKKVQWEEQEIFDMFKHPKGEIIFEVCTWDHFDNFGEKTTREKLTSTQHVFPYISRSTLKFFGALAKACRADSPRIALKIIETYPETFYYKLGQQGNSRLPPPLPPLPSSPSFLPLGLAST